MGQNVAIVSMIADAVGGMTRGQNYIDASLML